MMDMKDMMIMYFHHRIREHVLFKDWFTTTEFQFVISCIGIVVLGILLEAFKTFRLYLFRRADRIEANKTCCGADVWVNTTSYGATELPSGSAAETVCECSTEQAYNSILNLRPYSSKFLLDRNHQIQTLLFFIQTFFSFSLMLIAMTYNTIMFISLIIGHSIGFWLFNPLFLPVEKVRVGDCCCG